MNKEIEDLQIHLAEILELANKLCDPETYYILYHDEHRNQWSVGLPAENHKMFKLNNPPEITAIDFDGTKGTLTMKGTK